jgi:hypothetical protein
MGHNTECGVGVHDVQKTYATKHTVCKEQRLPHLVHHGTTDYAQLLY